MGRKRSWREKLDDAKDLPRVQVITGRLIERWGSGTFVIPAPREVDELMRAVPRGRLTTIEHIRTSLAKRHGATIACPITTGILAWIAAHAADEAEREGRTRVTPYWRTLKSNGELNPKYPGGIANVVARLKAEGHVVTKRGKRWFVPDVEDVLARARAARRRAAARKAGAATS